MSPISAKDWVLVLLIENATISFVITEAFWACSMNRGWCLNEPSVSTYWRLNPRMPSKSFVKPVYTATAMNGMLLTDTPAELLIEMVSVAL